MNNEKTALAVGAFDGLHKGHIKLIKSAVMQKNLTPAVLTFSEDPTVALTGKSEYVISQKEKAEILKQIGVKECFMLEFSNIKDMSAEEFFHEIIVKKCNTKKIFCGDNFRFGKKALGDTKLLKKLCDENDIELNLISFEIYDDEIISSTRIRKAIMNADMSLAKELLGRYYGFDFVVVKGNQIGRTLGTPTINQIFPKGFVLPKFGVYASIVTVENKQYIGVTNIGTKPSIGNYDPSSETWVLDLNKDMYGMEIRVELVEFIREEQKFLSLDELKNEIRKNAEQARKIITKIIGG